MGEIMRLQKYLAHQGIASRRESEKLIADGLVKVNGKTIVEMGVKIDPDRDAIEVNRQALQKRKEKLVYVILNKPTGYVTTCHRTEYEKKIVTDLVDIPERIYPVGRLDKDTAGLLLMTNDGDLTYKLTHPKFEKAKEYQVRVQGKITEGSLAKLREGVKLWGEKTNPTKIKRLSGNTFLITLTEGKNRQIRRICRKVGFPVLELERVKIKDLAFADVARGKWRFLTKKEIEILKND